MVNKGMNGKKNKKELEKDFSEIIANLKADCDLYDKGLISKYRDISTNLRKLLIEKNGKLIKENGYKNNNWISTCNDDKEGSFSHFTINTSVVVDTIYKNSASKLVFKEWSKKGIAFKPLFYSMFHMKNQYTLQFNQYLNELIIIGPIIFTRKNLITEMRNQEGSHNDIILNHNYKTIKEKNRYKVSNLGKIIDFEISVEKASIRQIAYEVLNSLNLFTNENNNG